MNGTRPKRSAVLLKFSIIACLLGAFPVHGADPKPLDQLERRIKEQQAQIEAQQKALEQMQEQVETLKEQTAAATVKAATVKAATDSPVAVRTGNPKATVKLYGQVDKAVLFSDDGNDSNLYLVDNDNSSTRVGLLGSIKPDARYEIGTWIEVEYQTNPSNLVSQEETRMSDATFEKRQLDLWVDAHSFGKFSLGWGSTASDNTCEVDLSGTSVVGYSEIASMAGGQLFYDNRAGALSGTAVRNVFSNMDGLSRDERIRYDSPSFGGVVASVSYISDGGGDIAVRYNVQVDSFKLAAAAAFSNPGGTSDIIEDQLAGSVSVLHDSGLNATVAMGTRDNKPADREDAYYFYTKFGYRGRWCPLGVTSLTMDYGWYADIGADGDDAETVGLQMVQDVQEWGTEVFLGCRLHTLSRDGADYDNINAVMTGMRVKF